VHFLAYLGLKYEYFLVKAPAIQTRFTDKLNNEFWLGWRVTASHGDPLVHFQWAGAKSHNTVVHCKKRVFISDETKVELLNWKIFSLNIKYEFQLYHSWNKKFIEIHNGVWNFGHNCIEFIFRSVIWLLLHLNFRFSFYNVHTAQVQRRSFPPSVPCLLPVFIRFNDTQPRNLGYFKVKW